MDNYGRPGNSACRMPKAITLGHLSTGSGHLRMPFTAANEPAALPQINIVTEYDSNRLSQQNGRCPAIQTKDRPREGGFWIVCREPITSSKAGGLIGNAKGGFKGCLDD
jgi:hypothetical protein